MKVYNYLRQFKKEVSAKCEWEEYRNKSVKDNVELSRLLQSRCKGEGNNNNNNYQLTDALKIRVSSESLISPKNLKLYSSNSNKLSNNKDTNSTYLNSILSVSSPKNNNFSEIIST